MPGLCFRSVVTQQVRHMLTLQGDGDNRIRSKNDPMGVKKQTGKQKQPKGHMRPPELPQHWHRLFLASWKRFPQCPHKPKLSTNMQSSQKCLDLPPPKLAGPCPRTVSALSTQRCGLTLANENSAQLYFKVPDFVNCLSRYANDRYIKLLRLRLMLQNEENVVGEVVAVEHWSIHALTSIQVLTRSGCMMCCITFQQKKSHISNAKKNLIKTLFPERAVSGSLLAASFTHVLWAPTSSETSCVETAASQSNTSNCIEITNAMTPSQTETPALCPIMLNKVMWPPAGPPQMHA